MAMSDLVEEGDATAEDAEARERALDVSRSFLVQAPAGSGKTELLIQRFLALLAHVDRPERVVAMTFTRKAAGEMRERIVTALAQAKAGLPPAKPHERLTFDLAAKALVVTTFSLSDHYGPPVRVPDWPGPGTAQSID